MNVLLVEDDRSHAELIQRCLARQGDVTVEHAPDVRRARECLERHPFHLVLLDFSLPDEDGLVLFYDIRTRFSRLPVVFLTAADSAVICARALKGGALDYLVKKRDYLDGLPRIIRKARLTLEARQMSEPDRDILEDVDSAEIDPNVRSQPVATGGERARIQSALERNHWNRSRAAQELGFSRITLWRRMSKYGLGV